MHEEIIEDVKRELDKNPIVKESIRRHIEDSNETMRLLGHTQHVVYVNDLVTFIGAPNAQKTLVKKLISKYGSYILEPVFVQIFYGKDLNYQEEFK